MNQTYQDEEPLYQSATGNDLHLHDWVFHFNPYLQLWAAIPREHYQAYWNDATHPQIFRSTRVSVLIELIQKTKGDAAAIESLVGNG